MRVCGSTLTWQLLPRFIYPSLRAVDIWDIHVFISYSGWYLMYVLWHCVKKKQQNVETDRPCPLLMKGNFISNCDKSSEGLMEMRRCPVVNEWANDCVNSLCKEEEKLCTFPQIQYYNCFFKLSCWFTVYCIYAFLPGGSAQCILGCSLLLHVCQWLWKHWKGRKCCFVSFWNGLMSLWLQLLAFRHHRKRFLQAYCWKFLL